MRRIRVVGRPSRDERGVYLILWALLLVALMTMVAIVLDLGQLRAVRRTNKSMADFAALSAGPGMAALNPRGACHDALKNLRANAGQPPLSTISQAEINTTCGDPATNTAPGLDPACNPAALPAASPAVTLTRGTYTVTVSYPVLTSDIADARFTGGVGLEDGTACQRMRVEIKKTMDTSFARVIGVDSQTSRIASVVRAAPDHPTQEKVAALLVLERTSCQALWTSGQGNVLIKKAGPDDPGILHADSLGTTNCTTGSPSQRFVVYGTSVPAGNPRAGQPSIQAEGPATTPPTPCPGGGVHQGFLHMPFPFSSTSAAVVPPAVGVCPAPTSGVITGRGFHDERWNPSTRTKTLNALRTSASSLLTATPPLTLAQTLRAAGYVVFPDDTATLTVSPAAPAPAPNCTSNAPYVISNAKVFINCAPLQATDLRFTGTQFVAAGQLRVGAGNTLTFPNATEIVVQGCSGTCQGNNASDSGIDVNNGTFTVNDGGAAACVSTDPLIPDRTGTTVAPAHLVVMKGRFSVTGSGAGTDGVIRMCQTFVYMAQGASPATTTGGHASCAVVSCPLTNNLTGDVKVTAKIVDWSAPNQSATLPANDIAPGPYEDLAFWSEAGGLSSGSFNNESSIGGNSTTAMSGVFFLPNGTFTFTGNTGINQNLNAQFVARRLNLNGQGALTMVPNPNDAVPTPFPGYLLIR